MKKGVLLLPIIFILSTCCDDELILINDCTLGIADYTIPASEVVDSSILACNDCPIDCQEIFSSAIPYDYFYPCFNPSDAEQIAYYQHDNTSLESTYELWVTDFCTGERRMIADNAFYGLDWSTKDWLAYTGGGKIFGK